LTEIVADASQPADERERAAEVLKLYSETVSSVVDYPRPEGTPQSIIDNDIAVARMFGQMYANHMWYDPDDCLFKDWPQTNDGSIHPLRSVVSKRFHGPRSVEPEPDPVPTAITRKNIFPDQVPAPIPTTIPLPVVPPSAVEEIEASMAQRRDLHERIEANERLLKVLREQHESLSRKECA
jgi:hypothetical protein